MKTLILLFLTIILCISCTKEPIEDPIIPKDKDVKVTLDYSFSSRSGDMKGASLYIDFYNKYITSKILTPKTYSINFYGIEFMNGDPGQTGQTVAGKWGSKALVSLAPGRYVIEGTSRPANYGVCGDTAYLSFYDTIEITEASTNLMLKAEYDCSLILLDTTEVKETLLFAHTTNWTYVMPYENSIKPTMMKTEEFYHAFLFNGTANGIGYPKVNLYLGVTSRLGEIVHPPEAPPYFENKSTTFLLFLYKWETGKYYYFENTNNVYNLPPMTNYGN